MTNRRSPHAGLAIASKSEWPFQRDLERLFMFTSPRYALCMPGLARIARRLGESFIESFIGLGIARPVSMAYPVLYQSRSNAGCCVGSVFDQRPSPARSPSSTRARKTLCASSSSHQRTAPAPRSTRPGLRQLETTRLRIPVCPLSASYLGQQTTNRQTNIVQPPNIQKAGRLQPNITSAHNLASLHSFPNFTQMPIAVV